MFNAYFRTSSREHTHAEDTTTRYRDEMKHFVLALLFICSFCYGQNLPGQKGEPGQPGDVGEPGISGVGGAKGDRGKMGPSGLDGLPGPSGPKGQPGLSGPPGPAQGFSGTADLPDQCACNESHSSPGHHCLKGEQGLDGLPGMKGDSGIPGPMGYRGFPGPKGDSGIPGPMGAKGDSAIIPAQAVRIVYPKDKLNLVELGDRKYVFVDQVSTWMEASYYCNSHGMELVTIETQQENDLVMAQIETLGLSDRLIWTSAHKLGRSTFLWQNGEALDFTDWKVGQPDSPGTEHCIVLYQGDWKDWICHGIKDRSFPKIAFICEERQ